MKKFLLILLLALSASLHAATITPTSVTASDTFGTVYHADNLINGSGLSGGVHDTDWRNSWAQASDDEVPAYVLFDLGAVYDITSTDVWNYSYFPNRGVSFIEYQSSVDGVSFSTVTSNSLLQVSTPSPAQRISLVTTAQFVLFNLLGTHGDQNYIGLSEVRFDGELASPSAVPVPAAAFLFAPALLGFVGLRRKARKVA